MITTICYLISLSVHGLHALGAVNDPVNLVLCMNFSSLAKLVGLELVIFYAYSLCTFHIAVELYMCWECMQETGSELSSKVHIGSWVVWQLNMPWPLCLLFGMRSVFQRGEQMND